MEKSEIISRMMMLLELLRSAAGNCYLVESEVADERFSKPLGGSFIELDRIHSRLKKVLKGYCGKDINELSGTALDIFEVKIERRQKNEKRNVEIFQTTRGKGDVCCWTLSRDLIVRPGDMLSLNFETGKVKIERRQKDERK